MVLLLGAVVLALSVGVAAAAAGPQRAAVPATSLVCDGSWQIAPSPSPAGRFNELDAVAAVDATHAFAVGQKTGHDPIHNLPRSLIEQWDGASWSVVHSPNVGINENSFWGVAAADATHAFAVGQRFPQPDREATLIQRWDGAAWSVIPSPNRGDRSYLRGVAMISPTSAWTVGAHTTSTGAQVPLAEVWDGFVWRVVAVPYRHGSRESVLRDVAAVSPTDVWAVGSTFTGRRLQSQPLVEHWDGSHWSIVAVPSPGVNFSLTSVDAVSADDVWAVGLSDSSLGNPFVEHWDGTSWSLVPAANPGNGSAFSGVAVAGGIVYATGLADPGPLNTLVEAWNGSSFAVTPSPNVRGAAVDNALRRASSDGTITWSVGYHGRQGGTATLIEYVC